MTAVANAPSPGSVDIRWDHSADVVVIGAGAAGLPAAISACDHGATVIVVDENFDIGGRAMLSGGRVQVGGGHALQKKFEIDDTPEQIYQDWVRHDHAEARFSDRELVRVFADENLAMYDFLVENGVEFIENPIRSPDASTVDRIFVTKEWHVPSGVIAPHRNRNGSGLVRRLEQSARKKGAQFFLEHKMTSIVREQHNAGRVLGITAASGGTTVSIEARKGVVVCTGGHIGNVNFRRMFDPRLTEEYEQAGEPYAHQSADGELAAMDIGASLWATAIQTIPAGVWITKTAHIGCRWGYNSLVWEPDSVMFPLARATGLTVEDWHNLILVNQFGKRFWDEADTSHKFFDAALANHGDTTKLNGGGPIWAIFDAGTVQRENWNPRPPHVDADGYFYSADTIPELAARIRNPHQRYPVSGAVLQATVNRYNSFADAGADADFKKSAPLHKIETAPFYAAWATPIVHDALSGLRTNTNAEVIDTRGAVIPGLYCAGESQGGFAQHGLCRCMVFGRIAGRHAAQRND